MSLKVGECSNDILRDEGCIIVRRLSYSLLVLVLVLYIGSASRAHAQGGCSIVNLKVNYPSPVSVGQLFAVTVAVVVWCAIPSFVRSDLVASLGSLSVKSTLTDTSATFAQSGVHLHELTLMEAGNWSLDGSLFIIDSYYRNPIASATYHYVINVQPALVTQTSTTTETIVEPANQSATTITQIMNLTTTQTMNQTITIETPTPTTVTSILTTTAQLITGDQINVSLIVVLAVLLLAVLIGLIVKRS